MLSLIIPVYRNEGSIPDLLNAVEQLHRSLDGKLEAVFVVDGSPDLCYEILREILPEKCFPAQLILLSKNFGSFQAIRAGLQLGNGDRFAVMAADLQEPPELILEMDRALREEPIDVVVAARDSRQDPWLSRIPAKIFWGLYRRYVVPELPHGGVDVFGCNHSFRDNLLKLDERHSSLIAQIFWLGFRRKCVSYARQARKHGKSAWTFRKKMNYLMDSIFAFTDLPIRLLIWGGSLGASVSGILGCVILSAKLLGLLAVPGYAITMLTITFLGAINLLGLGIVGSYAWRAYENTKARPLSIIFKHESLGASLIRGNQR